MAEEPTRKTIFFIYNSFKDPLFQSNLYRYLLYYQDKNDRSLVQLITFEQKEYLLSKDFKEETINFLLSKNISWKPLKWHSGKFKLLKKTYDLVVASFQIFAFRIKGYNRIVTLGTPAAIFAFFYSKLFFFKHFIYQYEPHFRFLLELDEQHNPSLTYKWLLAVEDRLPYNVKGIATGTKYMVEELSNKGIYNNVYLVPSCVDEDLFTFNAEFRAQQRNELNIEDRIVLLYSGKFGGLYYDKAYFEMMLTLKELDSKFFFLIVSKQDHGHIHNRFKQYGIDKGYYHITSSSFEEMPLWLSIGDLGIVTVPPKPSQKYRSPIKVGEYLCCGLPYLICEGVSEDDYYANRYNVGIIVKDFTKGEGQIAYPKIIDLLNEPKDKLRNRCREVGRAYRGFGKLKDVMYKALNEF